MPNATPTTHAPATTAPVRTRAPVAATRNARLPLIVAPSRPVRSPGLHDPSYPRHGQDRRRRLRDRSPSPGAGCSMHRPPSTHPALVRQRIRRPSSRRPQRLRHPPRRAGIFPVLGVFPVIGVSRQHERLFRRASHDARPGTGRPSRRTCRHRQQQRGENEHELDRDHEAGGRLLGGGERGTRRRIGLEPVEHTAVGGTGLNESRPLIERCHSRRAQERARSDSSPET